MEHGSFIPKVTTYVTLQTRDGFISVPSDDPRVVWQDELGTRFAKMELLLEHAEERITTLEKQILELLRLAGFEGDARGFGRR